MSLLWIAVMKPGRSDVQLFLATPFRSPCLLITYQRRVCWVAATAAGAASRLLHEIVRAAAAMRC